MQYMGGKTRIAKQIATEIDRVRKPGQLVWDAFCGGLSMTKALSVKGPVRSSDFNLALVSMYRALYTGWDPPATLTIDEWQSAKQLPDTDPLKAYVGFACSFGAKWFGGYAGKSRPSYARPIEGAQKKVRLDRPFANVEHIDFLSVSPTDLQCILYLDPPYAGTSSYSGMPSFDHELFTKRVKEWSFFCDVFVSEYQFPVGSCVWEGRSSTTLNAGKSGKGFDATERLFFISKGSL